MSGWAGFTDAELQKLKGPAAPGSSMRPGGRKTSNFTKPKVMPQQRKAEYSADSQVISPEQRLSQPPIRSNNNNNTSQRAGNQMVEGQPCADSNSLPEPASNKADNNGNVENAADSSTVVKEVQELDLDQSEVLSHQLSKLEKYQQQQKMIEELNKQRKSILSKAISERSKKAKAEATKLKHIEKELSHLDQQLTGGVTIIRDRIERASIAYLDAQHKYEKAEKEFINAKVDLHEKAEMKEQLTEHLYTIIHQNEIRKSQKLAQLMKELEMEISTDEVDLKVDLPPLSSFSTMQTLSPSRVPTALSYPAAKDEGQESKMADNNATATTGSQPHSGVSGNSESQPIINSPEQIEVCDTQASTECNKMHSPQTSDQSLSGMPDKGKEHSNSPFHMEGAPTNQRTETMSEAVIMSVADTADTQQQQQISNSNDGSR